MTTKFKIVLFSLIIFFKANLVFSQDNFCLEKDGFIYPLFDEINCLNKDDEKISKKEFINILDIAQNERVSKLDEIRKNLSNQELKTEKDIKEDDVKKIKNEAIVKIEKNKKDLERLAKIEKRKQEQERKKQERLAKIEKRKQEQERKKQERLAKIAETKKNNQTEEAPVEVNENLKVVFFNKKIVKNSLLPNIDGEAQTIEVFNKQDLKGLVRSNSNLFLIIPNDLETFSNNVSQNIMSSTVVSGIRQIPNPEYRRLEMEIQDTEQKAYMAKREAEYHESSLSTMQSSGVGWLDTLSAFATTGAAISYQNKYHDLQSKLSQLVSQYSTTPMFLDKEVFSPYNYDVVNVKSEKKAHYDVIKYQNEKFYFVKIIVGEEKDFRVAYNIQPQDKRFNELSQKYNSMDQVRNWENKKLKDINIDDLLYKIENSEKRELDGLKDLYVMFNFEQDKKKSFWNKIFGSSENKKKKKKTASLSNSSYEIKDERFNSVVVIKTGSGLGTGFFVSKDEILTNYHVIEGAMSISIIDQNKKRSSAVVLKTDLKRDLALLKTNMKGDPVNFYEGQLKQGEMVEALGHPKGRKFSLTKGWISAIRKWDSVYSSTGSKDVLFIQTDAAINSGNSGGPLFYKDKVIGVNTQKMVDTDIEGMNFAVHFSEVNKFLSN